MTDMTSEESPRLISKHALVLLHISDKPHTTYLEIGRAIGITERHAVRLVRDLESSGAIGRSGGYRAGNTYSINNDSSVAGRGKQAPTVRQVISTLKRLKNS